MDMFILMAVMVVMAVVLGGFCIWVLTGIYRTIFWDQIQRQAIIDKARKQWKEERGWDEG